MTLEAKAVKSTTRMAYCKFNFRIDLLLQQCSRLTLVWMLLLLEKTRTEVLSKNMDAVANVMAKNIESISSFVQILNSISLLDYSNKDRKAVIDKRDSTMLNLHDLLGKGCF